MTNTCFLCIPAIDLVCDDCRMEARIVASAAFLYETDNLVTVDVRDTESETEREERESDFLDIGTNDPESDIVHNRHIERFFDWADTMGATKDRAAFDLDRDGTDWHLVA